MSWRSALRGLVLMGLVAAVTACTTLDRTPRSPEAIVKERAQARWDALVRSDVAAAYGYLSPGTKSLTSLEQYTNSIRKGFWKSVVVNDAVCKEDSCEVSATMIYEMDGVRYKSPYKEKWIREGSDWWYFLG